MRKIGVLMPQSKTYPTLGKDFINGVKLVELPETSLVVEGIGIGDDVKVISEKIDKLVLQDDVDVIIGLFGDNGLSTIYEKVNSLEVPTIFARMGAYPDISIENNKYAFTLSYGLCDSLNFLGEWIVNSGFSKVGVSGSFNDAGYGFLSSLEKSLYANGGEFSGHYTPPLNPREDEAKFLRGFYSEVESEIVCQLYNGIFAKENVEYLETIEGGVKQPLAFMPFALDEELLERTSKISDDLFVFGAWLPVSLTKSPANFDNRYYRKYDKYPSVTAMLGFQAMSTVESILPKRKQLLAGEAVETVEGAIEGAWGQDLRMTVPFKVWKMDKSGESAKLIEEDVSKKEYNVPFEGQEKGWHNAYLCY